MLLLLAGASACGEEAPLGQEAFDANCAICHGAGPLETESGPPLLHSLYVPGRHSDDSIRRAVRNGVPSHHWSFGDMPPRADISDKELEQTIAYVQEQQRAGGIY